MSCEPDHISFGRYLNTARIKKGVRIEDVSRDIRVGPDMLARIETEDHARLPAETYVKGFIRAYAGFIGEDPEPILRSYRQSFLAYRRAMEAEQDRKRHAGKFWLNLTMAFGALALMIALTVVLFSDPPADKAAMNAGEASPRSDETAGADAERSRVYRQSASPELTLVVTAVRDTRFKVIIDHHPPEEKVLGKGARIELHADETINILLGDAAAVHMTLNDKPYPLHGADGHPVNINIP